MTAELFSFKLLIHGFSLDANFYHSIGSYINVPGFAVQLFDYPTFIIYSSDRLYEDQIGQDKWIKFGNGKSTAFEMSEGQLYNFVNDRPLIINFIDAENKQVRVFSKVIVTLQAFKNDLQNYLDKNQENWKRKIFVMFDESKNPVGKIDLSLSLARRRKNLFDKPQNESANPEFHQPIYTKPQFNASYNRNPSISEAQKQRNEQNMKSRAQTDDYIENSRPYDEIDTGFQNQNQNQNSVVMNDRNATATAKIPQDKRDNFTAGPPTLKTMVEGFYCPPIMLFQNKKKLVRFASNEEQPVGQGRTQFYNTADERPLATSNKPYNRSASAAFRRDASSVSMADNTQEQQVRPVVVLSNKESEKLVDLYSLKGAKDENVGILDLLIKELVNLKAATGQISPDLLARTESLQIGSLRSQGTKQLGPLRRSSFGSDKNKENLDSSNHLPSPKKTKGILKGRDFATEVIKETYEEANQPEEEYSQIFESISASQSQSLTRPVIGTKKTDLASNRQRNTNVERMESIGESYPEDFEQMSAASASHISNRNKPYRGNNDDSRDMVSEDIAESGSRIYEKNRSMSMTRKDSFKRDPLRESIRSEYSEDFENLSEDNY